MPEAISFLMISRMLASKGVLEYLEAASTVKQNYSEVRFVLLGAFENLPDSLKREELRHYFDQSIVEHLPETKDAR